MEVAEKKPFCPHFLLVSPPFDVTQPVGHWQCGLMEQIVRLEPGSDSDECL